MYWGGVDENKAHKISDEKDRKNRTRLILANIIALATGAARAMKERMNYIATVRRQMYDPDLRERNFRLKTGGR